MSDISEYPPEWPLVSLRTKEEANWRCVRCGHPNERPGHKIKCDRLCDPTRHRNGRLNDGKQRILTVHHLDGDKHNLNWWNLAALCQVCHLQIQGKVVMERRYIFEHSDWFKPYAAGYYAFKYLGENLSRDEVMERLEELLALERVI